MRSRLAWSKVALVARIFVWGIVCSYALMAIGSKTSSPASEVFALGLVGAFCGGIIGMTFNNLAGRSREGDHDL
jgi:4-hydroxybenzoate polyprenyltransferase